MSDRFDFEQQIMNCWNITSELKVISEYVLESDEEHIKKIDKISNMLIGLEQLYDVKFDNMFRMFEQLIQEKKIL